MTSPVKKQETLHLFLVRLIGVRVWHLEVAKASNAQQSVLWLAIALILDSGFAAPEIAENRIALSHGVDTEALREAETAVLQVTPDDALDPPIDFDRGLLRTSGEVDVVLDFQAAERIFQQR